MTLEGAPVKALPPALFIADRRIRPDMLAIIARLPRHCAVLYRDYDAPDRAAMARRVRQATARRGVTLIIAGDDRLARRIGADGLHLPEWRLRRPLTPPPKPMLLTAACHSRRALARAALRGVDAVLVSPLFSTSSHPGETTLGIHRFLRLIKGCDLPVYALGGLDAGNIDKLPDGIGVAAGSAFADRRFMRDQKLKRVPR